MTTPLLNSRRREPSISSRTQRFVKKMAQVEMDIPVLRKFFLCLPLRVGLYVWGTLLLLGITSITFLAIEQYQFHMIPYSHHYGLTAFVQVCIMYFITMLVSSIEVTFAIMLLIGTKRRSIQLLTIVYRYYTVKIVTYGLLLLICYIVRNVAVSEAWFYRNVDEFHQYMLYYSPMCGLVDILMQMYVAILIRSEVIHLRGDSKTVYHIPAPVTTPTIPDRALPEFIDPNNMYKY